MKLDIEEVKYPIWSIECKWVENGEHNPEYPFYSEGLPPGRVRNLLHLDIMFKEDSSQDEIEKAVRLMFADGQLRDATDKEPSDLVVAANYLRHDTWCLHWFCHWTFDVGQSDEEAIESFERYVRRTEEYNNKNMEYVKIGEDSGYWREPIPLMGAEDRWRWRGENDGDPPCRCEGCKSFDIIRICH